jgi:hypothetical protein
VNPFRDLLVLPSYSVVDGVLEADADVSVARAPKPREHLELHVFPPADLRDYVTFEPIEETFQDRASHGEERRHVVRHWVPLALDP